MRYWCSNANLWQVTGLEIPTNNEKVMLGYVIGDWCSNDN